MPTPAAGLSSDGAGGGTGRPLNEVVTVFPDPAEHIAWVQNGSPAAGTPYGNPDRPGGAHISSETSGGPMPAFGDLLTEEEILAVVRYEREILGGESESALAGGEGGVPAGEVPTGEAQSEGGETSAGGGSGG
ncbi:MAG: hypothetical protein KY450_04680 [Actinobacteria bacterium]|nr:hypothetical protein [Actinomycetota bacterium]